MLHNLLRRLETLQEEMNSIREELVDTIKESFDLETLKMENLEFGDDSEEEEEETEAEMMKKSQSNKEIIGKVGSNDEEQQEEEYPGDDEEEQEEEEDLDADDEDEDEEATMENPEDMESPTEGEEEEDDESMQEQVNSIQDLKKELDPQIFAKLMQFVKGQTDELDDDVYDALYDTSFVQDMPYGTMKARTGDPEQWIKAKLAQLDKGSVAEESDETEDETDDSDIENHDEVVNKSDNESDDEDSDDEDESDVDDSEDTEDEEEVDEEADEKKNLTKEKTFSDLEKDEKFKLDKSGEEFIKTTSKGVPQGKYRSTKETNPKQENVIMNPKTKIIPVEDVLKPQAPEIKPSGQAGDSSPKTPKNDRTGTSQDKSAMKSTSQDKPAKQVQPTLEEKEGNTKVQRKTVSIKDPGITSKDVDEQELAKGKRHEMEHTTDPKIAEIIALGHLKEIPDYYSRLERMEREASGEESGDEAEQDQQPVSKSDTEKGKAEPESLNGQEQDPAVTQEKKSNQKLNESKSFLDGLVNKMISDALENVDKSRKEKK